MYNVFFYFLNRPIEEIVVIRIRIIYSRALRGLQEDDDIEAESVPSTCTIKDEYKEKVGETSEKGENVDYDCTAPTSSVADIKNATVDTDYPLDLGNGTTVNFTDINFDEDAAEEAVNLIEIKNYTKAGALDGSTVEFLRNSFRINGTATPENLFIDPEKTSIKMQFINYKNEEEYGIKNVTCSIKEISSSSNNYSLDCGSSLKSYISNITVAKSLDNDTFLKININQEEPQKSISVYCCQHPMSMAMNIRLHAHDANLTDAHMANHALALSQLYGLRGGYHRGSGDHSARKSCRPCGISGSKTLRRYQNVQHWYQHLVERQTLCLYQEGIRRFRRLPYRQAGQCH